MGREKPRNTVSVHVTEADGRSMNVEVYDEGSVAQQLLSVFGRALNAYRDEVKTQVEAAAHVQQLMDELGITGFLGQLARVWGPHPSTVGEPPAEPGYVEWSGSLGDQLREIVAQARAFDVDDDDLREALEQALAGDEVSSKECRPVPSTVGEPPAVDDDRVIELLEEMNAQQHKTDEEGGREVAWYYWRGAVARALGLPADHFESSAEAPAKECRPVPCPPFVDHEVKLLPDPDRATDLEQAHAYATGVDMPTGVAGRLTEVGPEVTVGVDLGGGRTVAAVTQAVPGRPGVYTTVVELPLEDVPAGYPYADHFTTE